MGAMALGAFILSGLRFVPKFQYATTLGRILDERPEVAFNDTTIIGFGRRFLK
jgi:hypothetical protein